MEETKSIDTIKSEIRDITNRALSETDVSKTNDLIALFNWNMSKKNLARVMKLDSLFDSITDQIAARVENKPDQFSNDELLNYMKTIQNAIDTSSKVVANIEEPPNIIQNNTQINVNVIDKFDRESRARILAAVQATLKAASNSNTSVIDAEFEDKTREEATNESI